MRDEPIWSSVERLGAEIREARLLDGGRLLISRGPTLEIHELDGAGRGAAVIIKNEERKHLSPGAAYAVKPVTGASEASMGHGVVRLKTGETVLRLSSGKVVNAWFSSDDRCLAIKQEETPDFYTLEFYDLQEVAGWQDWKGSPRPRGRSRSSSSGAIASRWSQEGNDTFWSRSRHRWPRISLNGWWRGES